MSDYGIRIRRGCQSGSAPGVSRLAIGRRHLSQLVADLVLERLGTVGTLTRVLGLPDHAELQLIDEAGHMPWFDDPSRVGGRVRRFLTD